MIVDDTHSMNISRYVIVRQLSQPVSKVKDFCLRDVPSEVDQQDFANLGLLTYLLVQNEDLV